MPPFTSSQFKRSGKRTKRIYSPASGTGDSPIHEVQPPLLLEAGSVDSSTIRADPVVQERQLGEDGLDEWESGMDEPDNEPDDPNEPGEVLYDPLDVEAGQNNAPRGSHSVQERLARFGASSFQQGKDEMNLAEFPIARLGRNDTRMSIEYRGQIIDKLGNVIEQRWIVSGNSTFGLPTEFADRVLVALMYITSKENLKHHQPDRRVPFTTYRILRLLGLTLNQRNYAAVEKALQQLVGVTIYSEDAFWDHRVQRRITSKKGFHILEEFWLKTFEGDDDTRTEAERQEGITGYVVWGERIWDSFQAGYIKNLDVEFYYALENTLARRLYRFLDKRMHYQQSYQIDIFDLAGRMGMKPYAFASQVARKLKPAFDELIERGFLARAEIVRAGDFTRVRFQRTPRFAQLSDADEADGVENSEDATEIVATLTVDAVATSKSASATTAEMSLQTATDGSHGVLDASRAQSITRGGQESSSPDFGGCAGLEQRLPAGTGEILAQTSPIQCQQLWSNLLADYQRTLPSATFAMLANSQLLSLEANTATIRVEPRYQQWLSRQMARQIKSHLNQQLNQLYSQLPESTLTTDPAWRVKDVRIMGEQSV
jgi:plasmid replication initiation protein